MTEKEFRRIVEGIAADRDIILKHNPIGTASQTLLWMLLSCLVSYLSLSDEDTPCFAGTPDADAYRDAILFVLRDRMEPAFDAAPYLDSLISHEPAP
jgi:hypothetical protein